MHSFDFRAISFERHGYLADVAADIIVMPAAEPIGLARRIKRLARRQMAWPAGKIAWPGDGPSYILARRWAKLYIGPSPGQMFTLLMIKKQVLKMQERIIQICSESGPFRLCINHMQRSSSPSWNGDFTVYESLFFRFTNDIPS